MNFKYFKNPANEVYAYDIDDETQLPYMQEAIDYGWEDITDSWPPAPTPTRVNIQPTVQELKDKLALLQKQLEDISTV